MENNSNNLLYNETKNADFGDIRLKERFKKIVAKLGEKIEESIPSAMNTWSETIAAYRFLANEKTTPEKIFAPHKKATIDRIAQEKVVLLLQDTTEFDFSSKRDTEGLGPTNTNYSRGFLLHHTLAVTPNRICLGSVSYKMWARKIIGNKGRNRDRTIENKESIRWIESFQASEAIARNNPNTMIVNVSDREGDIYELFQQTDGIRKENGAHFIVRSAYNRKACSKEHGFNQYIKDVVYQQKASGTISFNMPRRGNIPARTVTQEVRFATVMLGGTRRKGETLPPLPVTTVLAKEITSAKNAKPVEWLLVSSIPISTHEEAVTMIKWYLCRWDIESFFHVLKQGCHVEKLQLEHIEKIYKCIALHMILAWRIMHIRNMARLYPNAPCTILFSENEWKVVYCLAYKTARFPKKPPRLRDIVVFIAQQGGFLARKGDGDPGIKTIWKGMRTVQDNAMFFDVIQRNL